MTDEVLVFPMAFAQGGETEENKAMIYVLWEKWWAGEEALIFKLLLTLNCKYSYQGQFQVTEVTSLNSELEETYTFCSLGIMNWLRLCTI